MADTATVTPAPAPSVPASTVAPPIPPPVQPTPGAVVPGEKPAAPPRRKAMDAMRDELRKRATIGEVSTTPPAQVEPAAAETPAPAAETVTPTPKEGKGEKVNPWKLVENYKQKLSEAEKQIADARTGSLAEQERQALTKRAADAEARIKQFEDDLAFTNYQKSEEFQKKHQQPYEAAWKRAMAELSEIEVEDDSGQPRPATANDMLELVNLPLQKARERAEALFGDFAEDAMAHRKEIRRLFDEQTAALEDARKNSATRAKQMAEQHQAEAKALGESIRKTWDSANSELKTDQELARFFNEREGDEEFNSRLKKGFELADQAFSENPLKPGLKPEERQAIVRRHAAVRNRAAAFGAMRHTITQLESKVSALEKELAQFKESEPGQGDGQTHAAPQVPASAMDRMRQELRKKAIRI